MTKGPNRATTSTGMLKLTHKAMADDIRPVDPTCSCMVCKKYSRAYIHSMVTKDAMGSQLLSYHNLHYMIKICVRLSAEYGSSPITCRRSPITGVTRAVYSITWQLPDYLQTLAASE
ncbi:unnamed protein product [Rhodiola kirilowii]